MKYIKICPQCGSINVKMPKAGFDLRMTVKDMCKDCGNIGNFPEVEITRIEEFRKELKSKHANNKNQC